MKNLSLYLVFCLILMQSCKKGNEIAVDDVTGKTQTSVYKDSISFSINEKKYAFVERYSFGSGNYPVNVKKSDIKISGGKLASETGGYYFYGAPDSTLYAARYEVASKDWEQRFKILFTKKYKDNELVQKPGLLRYPVSHNELFKTGKPGFAVDLDKENTMEGVAIELLDYTSDKMLISMIPGFSRIIRTDLKNDIQDNSVFSITKAEKTADGQYMIEAKFELNLFDKDGKLYRVKDGFLRLKALTMYN